MFIYHEGMPFGFKTLSSPMSFFFFIVRKMNVVSLVANEIVGTDRIAGAEILRHGCVTRIYTYIYACLEYIPIFMLTFMFWIIIKKCTICKLVKKSRTPEIMAMEISFKNTARDNEATTEGSQARMDFLLESSLCEELENFKQSDKR